VVYQTLQLHIVVNGSHFRPLLHYEADDVFGCWQFFGVFSWGYGRHSLACDVTGIHKDLLALLVSGKAGWGHVPSSVMTFQHIYNACIGESMKLMSVCTGDEYEKNGRIVEYKTYNAMMSQIWSLLPGFCTRPTDLADVSLHIVLCCRVWWLVLTFVYRYAHLVSKCTLNHKRLVMVLLLSCNQGHIWHYFHALYKSSSIIIFYPI